MWPEDAVFRSRSVDCLVIGGWNLLPFSQFLSCARRNGVFFRSRSSRTNHQHKTWLQKNAEENQRVDFRFLAAPRTISNTKTQLQKNTKENQKLFSRIQTTDWSIDACVCWSASWASFPDVSNCCDKSRQQSSKQASIAQWLTDWLLEKQQQQQQMKLFAIEEEEERKKETAKNVKSRWSFWQEKLKKKQKKEAAKNAKKSRRSFWQ